MIWSDNEKGLVAAIHRDQCQIYEAMLHPSDPALFRYDHHLPQGLSMIIAKRGSKDDVHYFGNSMRMSEQVEP